MVSHEPKPEEQGPKERHPQSETYISLCDSLAFLFVYYNVADNHRDLYCSSFIGDIHLFEGVQSGLSGYEARYLCQLGRYCSKNVPPSRAPSGSLEWLRTCVVSESDVTKVLPSSCVHLKFHPTTDTILLAAGDKYGNLAIWHHDSKLFDEISFGLEKTGRCTVGCGLHHRQCLFQLLLVELEQMKQK